MIFYIYTRNKASTQLIAHQETNFQQFLRKFISVVSPQGDIGNFANQYKCIVHLNAILNMSWDQS